MSNKRQYNNVIYAFDIETTTTAAGNVSHYLSSFMCVDFSLRAKPNAEIVNAMSPPRFCRTAAEVNDELVRLNEEAKQSGKTTLIYVHNLAYEITFLMYNCPFVNENYKNEKALFIKRRIPLFIKLDFLELRCSYKLLNKSLDKIGENLGYKKLSIDYDKQYFSFSELPPTEYEYNKRDVEITLLSVLKECSRFEWITSPGDIPLTSTGFTRKNDIYINTRRDSRYWVKCCDYQRYFDKDYIDFLERVFMGGYNHSNAYYTNMPLRNIYSVDIVSSYIDTILHRKYPSFFTECKLRNKTKWLKKLILLNKTDYLTAIKNYAQPFKYAFIAAVTLENVRPKTKDDNLILPLSVSKCDFFNTVRQDNGRIYSAKLIKTNITEVDYFIYSLFYDFDIVDCERLVYTNYFTYFAPFVLNSTRAYLNAKSVLKDILAHRKNGDEINRDNFYCAASDDYIYNDEQIAAILDAENKDDILNDNYRASKNILNSSYGKNVQKLLNPVIKWDIDIDEFTIEDEIKVQAHELRRDFTKGLYITAYSRLNLFCYACYLMEHCPGVKLIYSDTDSWKCAADGDELKRVNNEYNKLIESVVHNSNDYNVGYFDFEAEYKYFATLGCKKYIFSPDGKKIISTIAGVNKKNASAAYTELFKNLNYDFDLLCRVAFSPSTILDYSVIDKLVTKYHNNYYNELVTDENGKRGRIRGYNMVELCKSDYILMDFSNPSVNMYMHHIADLQGVDVETTATKVYRDERGEVTYKYITDWKAETHILKGVSVENDKTVNGG